MAEGTEEANTAGHRYEAVARALEEAIEAGVHGPGDRLPGVRKLAAQFGVSVSTVVAAEHLLEDRGLIEARPRSGYYVRRHPWQPPERPATSAPEGEPVPVTGQALVLRVVQAASEPEVVQMGAAVPHADFLPARGLRRAFAGVPARWGGRELAYAFPPGPAELRQAIARRMADAGCQISPEEVVVTNGAQEALVLSLRAVTEPGDVVAIESPTFYGILQAIEGLGLRALEIPTDPDEGIAPEALALALDQWPVKAALLMPNFGNPLGHCAGDERKRALVELLEDRGVPLIEDDVYGDLPFEPPRPWAAKAFETRGGVLYCGSFSKTLSPGLRVGWAVPGRFRDRLEYLKYATSSSTPAWPGLAVADFLERGGYDRYLRRARGDYARAVDRVSRAVVRHFPPGTRQTRPAGGFVLWLELPEAVDALALYRRALEEGISVAPGPMFSPTGKFRNHLRLNCAQPWDARLERALARLGEVVRGMVA
ncbi:DNA-binding transcriptional regulator, MocR family, contains an aminotransferase domain [Thiohalospira halophila DSM 15071]|uniref:DNA-binding transcriptional regulator, MocR family, contains an aminotransferase domain n=1 Tax=Thiohalospira halophila DSM 15071 TaxID=1123397 RepID=A0A1I1SHF4_9GAMM|nr:PLP-dependent aminotransferase family protein [Thiohalospira halophila]SFD45762.1 DNA-binding transcriptional regulator, MocR family, contains an aminotransferase domain [Thiohalospira halophila DSM 15071]